MLILSIALPCSCTCHWVGCDHACYYEHKCQTAISPRLSVSILCKYQRIIKKRMQLHRGLRLCGQARFPIWILYWFCNSSKKGFRTQLLPFAIVTVAHLSLYHLPLRSIVCLAGSPCPLYLRWHSTIKYSPPVNAIVCPFSTSQYSFGDMYIM